MNTDETKIIRAATVRESVVGTALCAVTARAERAEHTRYDVRPDSLRRSTRRGQRSALSLPGCRLFTRAPLFVRNPWRPRCKPPK